MRFLIIWRAKSHVWRAAVRLVGHRLTERICEANTRYHSSFSPNWTWRDVVDVLVIAPAVGETPEGVNTTALGKLKFSRFNRLNISALNCRLNRSLMRVSFSAEKSQVARPGPMMASLPTLP